MTKEEIKLLKEKGVDASILLDMVLGEEAPKQEDQKPEEQKPEEQKPEEKQEEEKQEEEKEDKILAAIEKLTGSIQHYNLLFGGTDGDEKTLSDKVDDIMTQLLGGKKEE